MNDWECNSMNNHRRLRERYEPALRRPPFFKRQYPECTARSSGAFKTPRDVRVIMQT